MSQLSLVSPAPRSDIPPHIAHNAPDDHPEPDILRAMAIARAGRTEGGFDAGVFALNWTVRDSHIDFTIRLGISDILSKTWNVSLSYTNPEITVGDSVNLFFTSASASITLGIDDRSGDIYAHARWSIAGVGDRVDIRVPLLPPFAFGLITAGIDLAGVVKYLPEIISTGFNFDNVNTLKHAVLNTAEHCGCPEHEVYETMRTQPDMVRAINSACDRANPQDLRTISYLKPHDIELALASVVHDERILTLLPNLRGRFTFSQETLARVPQRKVNVSAVDTGLKADDKKKQILEYVKDCLMGVAGIAGLSATAFALVCGILLALALAVAATGAGAPIAAIMAVVSFFCAALALISVVVGVLAIFAALIIDGFIRFGSEQEFHQGLKAQSLTWIAAAE
ncbi:hypothetical protein [Woodsholea maritima]|uniref:hypothetical protein n=1 Tax=Woodsholea maritima TaxID=240237 RepID=UPI0003782A88|nr:hypothetical protein [Woodsholea maritima]